MEVILDHLPGKQEHGLVRAALRVLSESHKPQPHSELWEEQQLKDAVLSSPPHKRKTDIPRPYCGGLNLTAGVCPALSPLLGAGSLVSHARCGPLSQVPPWHWSSPC